MMGTKIHLLRESSQLAWCGSRATAERLTTERDGITCTTCITRLNTNRALLRRYDVCGESRGAPVAVAGTGDCQAHRYRIEEANGTPTVWGHCQVCGHTRWYNAGDQFDGSFFHPGRDLRDLL